MRKQDQWNKQGHHEISGDGSHRIEAFKLAETNQDTERRNFQGFQTYTPGEALMDEISNEGTTETRSGGGMNKSHSKAAGQMSRRFK